MLRPYSVQNATPIQLSEPKIDRKAEVHPHEDDVFLVLEGTVEFTVGGKLADPVNPSSNPSDPTITSPSILDGKKYVLSPGNMDSIHIPAGVPHQWRTEGPVSMIVIKLPAPEGRVDFPHDR